MRGVRIWNGAPGFGLVAMVVLVLAGVSCSRQPTPQTIVDSWSKQVHYPAIKFYVPAFGLLFPADIAPYTFSWDPAPVKADGWLVEVRADDSSPRFRKIVSRPEWTPNRGFWDDLKKRSTGRDAELIVLGFRQSTPPEVLSMGRLTFRTSEDPVIAPIFYREVNLPFLQAVTDPSRIRWRFGSVDSSERPKVVLEGLPVCGNCHSFSRDGKVLGMDVDYGNNKGSYVITPVAREMQLASSDVMTWDNFKPEDHQKTYGLLSQVSPDGQTVVSTVKDKSVFVAKPDLAFSQLFFPLKGILATYRRQDGVFRELPGADDPKYVQSNPVWSPDSREIVFARAPAYELKSSAAEGKLLLSAEDCAEFLQGGKPFQYDLYRIQYNEGRGGTPVPIQGASRNGRSNFFPKFSPDGKWIVFCQAASYMLLQPDSELFIVPAEGGTARRLRCNAGRMNSWHSWSPNGRWLVFSSKAESPYTRLCLAHIDERGESSAALPLPHFTDPDRAANIPEFVNAAPDAITKINQQFVDDFSHARAGYVFETGGEIERAMAEYAAALRINPRNAHAHQRLGALYLNVKHDAAQGLPHTQEALRLNPGDGCAHFDLAQALSREGKFGPAIEHVEKAIELMPEGFGRDYQPADMQCELGQARVAQQQPAAGAAALEKALALNPKHGLARYWLAFAQAAQGLWDEPSQNLALVLQQQPAIDTLPELHYLLAQNLEKAGHRSAALVAARRATELARRKGEPELIQACEVLTAQLEDAGAGR